MNKYLDRYEEKKSKQITLIIIISTISLIIWLPFAWYVYLKKDNIIIPRISSIIIDSKKIEEKIVEQTNEINSLQSIESDLKLDSTTLIPEEESNKTSKPE